ncbi:M48 family metallopeptidase [Dermabacter sp. p3-SID358]|uniref:M48 family metallopeptidase n=1 Tax=Dermabacter sp. p3-SID358 TaxID=2916114 RepID=UPI0021A59C61|nr:M48 family metallopeptidase [Dermabacter sp. p3-SID358]MCT1867757.1 M48 family metallopeptidase [Dermabacter sp. p3-SID358]
MTEFEQQHVQPLQSEPKKPAGKPGLFNGSTRHGLLGDLSLRHPWDIPLFIAGIVLTCLLYIAWVGAVGIIIYMIATGKWSSIQPAIEGENEGLSNPYSPISMGIQLFVAVMLIPWVLWIARALMYAQIRASGVRMSPTQFPEGYRMVAEAAEQFGMRRVPDAYVLSGNGMINAFAAGHGFRRFVCVYSDLFEVGGKARDPEALRFIIAHEVGHHAAGHTSYFRLLFTNLVMRIPIYGMALSRAQEYTADNFGYANVPAGAPGTMALLAGGKYLNAHVNVHELADRAATEKGFWLHLVNLSMSHPLITWRAHALRDRSKAGRMFLRPKTRIFDSYLPAGSTWSGKYPTPEEALELLERARAEGHVIGEEQFGRFPFGQSYPAPEHMRPLQVREPSAPAANPVVLRKPGAH